VVIPARLAPTLPSRIPAGAKRGLYIIPTKRMSCQLGIEPEGGGMEPR